MSKNSTTEENSKSVPQYIYDEVNSFDDALKMLDMIHTEPDNEANKEIGYTPISPRRRLPPEREAIIHKFNIGEHERYISAGKYPDGTLGEIFIGGLGKDGSTLRGMIETWAITVSLALQHGVTLATLANKFAYMRFEPEGITSNPEINVAKSIPDYVIRWLVSKFGSVEDHEIFGIMTKQVKENKAKALDAAGM